MSHKVLDDISHRRYNPLRGTWLLVSPHRTKRPWQGQLETLSTSVLPNYDPSCYLCPGNKRAQGESNPKYTQTFLFENDYSAVKKSQPEYLAIADMEGKSSLLLRAEPVTGICYVLAFSPLHNQTLADLAPEEILPVIQEWARIYADYLGLAAPVHRSISSNHESPRTQYKWMQIFENKGAAMGCSNPHPHGQIWITSSLPEEPSVELVQLQKYRKENSGRHLLVDYAELEIKQEERIVFYNESFLVVCPWWAVWPFEVMIIARQHKRSILDLNDIEKLEFAEAISEVTRRYDNLFESNFPYSSGIHQAPLTGTDDEFASSHLHMHFYPPLLRSATVKKFLVGYELMAEPQRDITPEQAAKRLREDCHRGLYRNNSA